MPDIGAVINQVFEAGTASPHGEIILLAIAIWEGSRIESPDRIDTATANIEAKAVPRGNRWPEPERRVSYQPRHIGRAEPSRKSVVEIEFRDREGAGIVGNRRHGTDAGA